MVKKMKRKIGLVFAVSIVAMLALGVTYGLWFQTLYVYGTVYTGTLDAQWSLHPTWDTEPPEKDYSNITLVQGQTPYDLIVTVDNAYPCIWYYALVDITNTGTIPWIIYDTSLSSGNLSDVGTVQFVPWDNEMARYFYGVDPHWGDKLFIENGTQVHPGESAWGVFAIHLDNRAMEDSTYTFSFKVVVEQWNEWPTPPPQGYDNNEEWLDDQ